MEDPGENYNYIELENRCQDLKDSAQFYFNAAIKETESILSEYDDSIVNYIGAIWSASYLYRLKNLRNIKSAQISIQTEELLEEVNCNDYYTLNECLAYWWQFTDTTFKAKLAFSSPGHANQVIAQMGIPDDMETQNKIRKLYCYLIQVESLAIEHLRHQYYILTGIQVQLFDCSITSALEISGAKFAELG
jgi:hypothetical protein